MPTSVVTLRARSGEPLQEQAARDIVVSTARAIAERHGVSIAHIDTTPDAVCIEVIGPPLVAIGLAAELRRLTNRWFAAKYGNGSLWGEVHHPQQDDEPDDPADWWKHA